MRVHVHVYIQGSEANLDEGWALVSEHDLELIEDYGDYKQYGFELEERWIEIRVSEVK